MTLHKPFCVMKQAPQVDLEESS